MITFRQRLFGALILGALTLPQTILAANSALPLPSQWKKKDSPSDIAIYSMKKGAGTETISFLDRKTPTSSQAPNSAEELKIKTVETVNRQLEVMGVHDWKVTSAQAFPLPHGKLFKLRGSYVGSANQKVFFEEWKFYLKQGFAQVTFSEEGKDLPSGAEYIETLLKPFKPLGESL